MSFDLVEDVYPPDDTTLFCSSGMQRWKPLFKDQTFRGTFSNIQSCLRLTDLDEVGDGTHGLKFDMMGLFSFREWTVPTTINFWFEFLNRLGLKPDVVTVHPSQSVWSYFYDERDVEVRLDEECIWSDGDQGGYCTEFYLKGVEIGNIVNTNGDCIDVGFGLDRLMLMLGEPPRSRVEELQICVETLIGCGYRPGGKRQGYILRKLLRELHRLGGCVDHVFFEQEMKRQARLRELYLRLLPRHRDKSPEWWMDTHGVDVNDF